MGIAVPAAALASAMLPPASPDHDFSDTPLHFISPLTFSSSGNKLDNDKSLLFQTNSRSQSLSQSQSRAQSAFDSLGCTRGLTYSRVMAPG
jgi:hypothetical protein